MVEVQATIQEAVSRITELISRRRYNEIEELWLNLLETMPEEVDMFLRLGDEMSRLGQRTRAGQCLILLLPALREKKRWPDALRVARKAVDFIPREPDLRGHVIECFREVFSVRHDIEQAISLSKIEEAEDLRPAVEKLDRFLAFNLNDHVIHAASWGVGVVTSVDLMREQITVDFKLQKNKTIALELASKILRALPPDHLEVWKFSRMAEIKAMVEGNPLELLKIGIKSVGMPADLRRLKDAYAPDIVPSTEWNKWWGKARKLLAKDQHFRIDRAAATSYITLHETPVAHGAVEMQVLEKQTAPADIIRRAYEVSRMESATKQVMEDLLKYFEEKAKTFENPEHIITARLLLDDMARSLRVKHGFTADALQVFLASPDRIATLEKMEYQTLRRELLRMFFAKATPDETRELCLAVLHGNLPQHWDDVVQVMLEKNFAKDLQSLFEKYTVSFREWPDQFFWLALGTISGKIKVPGWEIQHGVLMEKLFTMMDVINKIKPKEDANKIISKFRSFLSAERGLALKEILKNSERELAEHILARVRNACFFNERVRAVLETYIARACPKIFIKKKEEGVSYADDAIIVSQEAYERRLSELKRISEVDIPHVIEEIGAAAEHGDLSENAEYTFALEKRKALMDKYAKMKTELERAEIIGHHHLQLGIVTVGTAVGLKELPDGPEIEVCVMGPWDRSETSRFVSYSSFLGKALVGKKVGAEITVEFPDGEKNYRLLTTKPCI